MNKLQKDGQVPIAKGIARLCCAVAFLAALIWLTPYLVAAFGPLREYNRVLEETDIRPGALYYSDVPQTVDGEFNNRDAIRYRV
ncbi:hypothetical protein LJC15_01910, partial [Desulfovibrio sp. OttesenSCG-928-G11]|nr:hypothetical protein [Desulfovibrio sp. OttesenSCG-928-G11]